MIDYQRLAINYKVYQSNGANKRPRFVETVRFDRQDDASRFTRVVQLRDNDTFVFKGSVYIPPLKCLGMDGDEAEHRYYIKERIPIARLDNTHGMQCYHELVEHANRHNVATILAYTTDDKLLTADSSAGEEAQFDMIQVDRRRGDQLFEFVGDLDAEDSNRFVMMQGLYSPDAGSGVTATAAAIQGKWIALAIFGAVCLLCLVAVVARLIAYLQKETLRERVSSGDVNLEEMGVKRLYVPKAILEKIPCQEYSAKLFTSKRKKDPARTRYVQQTCGICLEDYVENVTRVRLLPCGHMFHPECIDGYLSGQSSLCPICKQSCLPRGYLPPDVDINYITLRRARRLDRDQYFTQSMRRPNGLLARLGLRRGGQRSANGPRRRTRRRVFDLPPTQQEEELRERNRPWIKRLWRQIIPVS